MLKSSILSVLSYHISSKNSIRSASATAIIILAVLIPLVLFFIGFFFEDEVAALIIYLFPPTFDQGYSFYTDAVRLGRTEILWIGFFLVMAAILVFYPSQASLNKFVSLKVKSKASYYMMLITSIFFFVTVFTAFETLEQFPNSSDEYAYLFQAEMFSRGKLWEPSHDLPDFFTYNNIPQHEGIQVSRFPPGWPLVLSVAFEAGIPAVWINPVLGVITLLVFYFFARKSYGELVAVWSLLALALTGMYIFNSASFFSHVSCLLVTLLFIWNVYLYVEKKQVIYGLLAGFFLGFEITIRYYTALLIFLPFFLCLFVQYRFRIIYLFLLMGLGSLPCVAYVLWYDYAITGNALLPVTVWAYPEERLGFVRGHTVMRGFEHLLRRALMFLYWCSPGLFILYLVFLWRKIKSPVERFARPEDYAFIALTIGYFFYYEIGGNQYGPRFLFEAVPFLVLFVVSKVLQNREKWAIALLLASIVFAIVKFPFISLRENMIVEQRQDVYRLVRQAHIRNAVVFISSSTSPIRPMPVQDLTRNDSRFQGDVIYAEEMPRINEKLMEYYPDRSFYKYVRQINRPHGELIRIR